MLPVQGVLDANDGQFIRAAVLKRLGILLLPTTNIREDVIAGRLVPELQQWDRSA